MRGKATDEAQKAEAIAMLAAGKSIRETAKETGLSVGTIATLRGKVHTEIEQVQTDKKSTFAEVLSHHFAVQVEALNNIAINSSTPEFIHKQNASGIAELHKTIAERTERLIGLAQSAALSTE